jgi:hypothetical protein
MRMRARIALAIAAVAMTACAAPPVAPNASPTPNSIAVVIATPAASGKGNWTAETGIYGTYNHFGNPPFGPPTYLCGVSYDLSYAGGAPLISVDVGAFFPDAFAAHVVPSMVDRAIGWQHPAEQINSPDIHDATWLSRLGGGIGAACRDGPSDLDSLRGTILRVEWTTVEGSFEQEFRVDDVRGEMTLLGMPDGRTRVCWGELRAC